MCENNLLNICIIHFLLLPLHTQLKIIKIMTNEQKELLLQIPKITNDKIALFVNDEFVDMLDVNQVNQYRYNIIKYIKETGDASIRDSFYFLGHLDGDEIGEEVKMVMEDNMGNFNVYPYELAHVRRQMLNLLRLIKELR